MAPTGETAWVYTERSAPDGTEGCPSLPFAGWCVVASSVVAVRPHGHRAFATGFGDLGTITVSDSGRLLAIDKGILLTRLPGIVPRGPVRVIDWVTGRQESLNGSVTYQEYNGGVCAVIGGAAPCQFPALSQRAQFSDDLTLVATTSHMGGWYEYTVAPVIDAG
jgi:hypothetical protein